MLNPSAAVRNMSLRGDFFLSVFYPSRTRDILRREELVLTVCKLRRN